MKEVVIGKDRVSIGPSIGKGGEGEVFAVAGNSGLAVKIYNANLRDKREGKVRAMVSAALAVKTDLVAYPGEIALDSRGNFVGFAMRLVSGYRPLHELYSPKSRQRFFPKVDYRFVIRAAVNVARAVGQVHQSGCVIGDLNHSGVLVARDATVALIDADSFQFRMNGKTFPCLVGVPDFTPPELHGQNLDTIERTIEHDNFGLAVALFHLLFMGRHPYAGRHSGPDTSLGESIAQNRFAFSLTRQSATRTTPPPSALTLDLFPDAVSRAFENAFGLNASARPGASTWIDVLAKLERSISRCSKTRTHYYPSSARRCVWCELASASGFDMFPDLSIFESGITTNPAAVEQAIKEILAFRFPTAADLLPSPPAVAGGPGDALKEARQEKNGQTLAGLLLIAGSIAGFIFATPFWFIWIGLVVWGWTKISGRKVETVPFLKAFSDTDERVQRELDAFVQRSGLAEVFKVRGDLDASISAYKTHDIDLARELAQLKSTRMARQRDAYLDRFSIRGAKIAGIGPAKTATLISFGIETAADITDASVWRVPGFGEVMTGKLMAWRRSHEARFRYDPNPNAQDIADEKAIRARFASEKAKLEASIRNGLGTLRNARAGLDALPTRARGDRALLKAVEERAHTEQDLKLLGVAVPSSSVTLSAVTLPHSSSKTPRATTAKGIGTPSCPRCYSPMRRRLGRHGQFWGCSRYPGCDGTRNI